MPYRLKELVDIESLNKLLEHFHELTGLGLSILDSEANILYQGEGQDICTLFHRTCDISEQRCRQNDSYIKEHLYEGPFVSCRCQNGLIDCAAPIFIKGEHLGTVFMGQFLPEPPDEAFFLQQARECGFDENAYLDALHRVPVMPASRLQPMLAFLSELAQLLTTMGLERITNCAAEQALRDSEERFRSIYEESPIGIEYYNAKGLLVNVNNACLNIFGVIDASELNGLDLFKDPNVDERCRDLLNQTKSVQCERVYNFDLIREQKLYHTTKTGESIIDTRITPLTRADSGQIRGYLVQVQDVTEKKAAQKQLEYLSFHDSLTGLYNRAYYEHEMQRLGRGRNLPVGIIICDVDGLKLVNDTLGHEAGDNLLKVAASLIKECFRDEDVVARIGGDEFAVLLPGTDKEGLDTAYSRIKKALLYHNSINQSIPLAISAGYAVSDNLPVNMSELYQEADNNMYSEKLNSRTSAYSSIVQTLMQALEERDFVTSGHVNRLQDMVINLARKLGVSENRLTSLRLLAQFHDIGKVGVPDHILFKPGPLTIDEFKEIKRHSEIGHRIAQTATHLMLISDWILKHHECWDGSGYPGGLKGDEIPLECRILSIADAFDAMTSDRPYRQAMSIQDAEAELQKCAGTQFDPKLVEEFIKVNKEERLQGFQLQVFNDPA